MWRVRDGRSIFYQESVWRHVKIYMNQKVQTTKDMAFASVWLGKIVNFIEQPWIDWARDMQAVFQHD